MAARKKASLIGDRTNAEFAAELHRLAVERDEALARERALAEVLHVINSSPGDLAPVFEAMLEKAVRLCEADTGHLFRFENGAFFRLASRGVSEDFDELFPPDRPVPLNPNSGPARMIATRSVVHVLDVREDESYWLHRCRDEVAAVEAGILTVLFVPLIKEGEVVGHFTMHRMEVRPFSDKQIALLENFAAQAVIAMENARLLTETREALAQQTATAEVLGVINSSPGDLQPVFDAVLEKATRLCDAELGALFRFDGEAFHLVTVRGYSTAGVEARREPVRPEGSDVLERLVKGENIVQVADLANSEAYRAGRRARTILVDLFGARTAIWVALRGDTALFGYFCIYRKEVLPFTGKQIALLQNFAAQAVIAMENARLLAETREALEAQQATAEVMQVINASAGDLAPVFQAMLDKAMALCGAGIGGLGTWQGDRFSFVAALGVSQPFTDFIANNAVSPGPRSGFLRVARGRGYVQFDDLAASPFYAAGDPLTRAIVDIDGGHTTLSVPLVRDDEVLGVITAVRREVRPFSERQIALLKNFAGQAVVAMENARLITETREALEQQTATAEVLGVINSSLGDLAPVFEAMLEKAMRLCGVAFGSLQLHESGTFRAVAAHGLPAQMAEEFLRPVKPAAGAPPLRLLAGESFVQTADLADVANQRFPRVRALAEHGFHTGLYVPLRRNTELLGFISAYRTEVRPFGDKQIALLQNFAAQAVIAMENARLITETREALEQQTATAEVLGVINSSPGELAPVFDAILEKAHSLCGAAFGQLAIFDGEFFRFVARHGEAPFIQRYNEPLWPSDGVTWQRIIDGEPLVHIADVADTDFYRSGHRTARLFVDAGGGRTLLTVALRKDELLLGALSVYRQEVRPFSDKQIALLQNFAAQAVIAIENARLLTETREALEKQTATAEILSVISSSPTDVQPTFEAIAARAAILCGAASAAVFRFDGALIHYGAMCGVTEAEREPIREVFPLPPGRSSATTRAIDSRAVVHIPDTRADPEYVTGLRAFGTALSVPMLRDGVPLGAITVTRLHVEPFSDAQIELLKTFADQAVIAIETVRLFTELNRRTRDLQESLEYQTATSDVLKVISGSSFDLQPVFDTISATAARLCGSDGATITIREGEVFRYVSAYALDDEYWAILRQRTLVPGRETIHGRVALEGKVVHVADITADPDYRAPETVTAGRRTILGVPLLREGTVVGTISMGRSRVEPFTKRQIELVRTFADQAVIAIENTRLLNEIRERTDDLQESLEYQTATSDVLKVISRSTFDLQPVLDTLIQTAARLCDGPIAALAIRQGDGYRYVATTGVNPELDAAVRSRSFGPGRGSIVPRVLSERGIIHIIDVQADPEYNFAEIVSLGLRTLLGVPMLRENEVIGVITVTRSHVEPFTERQIELVRTFADQAVIAIENTRLLEELRESRWSSSRRSPRYCRSSTARPASFSRFSTRSSKRRWRCAMSLTAISNSTTAKASGRSPPEG